MDKLDKLAKLTFLIIVVTAPLQWITIITIGGLSIKFVHLGILPVLFCFLSKKFRHWILEFYLSYKLLINSFFLLMVFNFIFTAGNAVNQETGISYISKNLSYLIYFILFGAVIKIRAAKPDFYKEVAINNFLCILIFLIVASVIFSATGKNFFLEMASAFFKGDSSTIRYDLFLKLFNTEGGDEEYQTSLRNTLIGAFIYVHFTSLYALKKSEKKSLIIINLFNIIFSVFMVLASTSRSNIVVLFLGYLLTFIFIILTRKVRIKPVYTLAGLVSIFGFLIFYDKLTNLLGNSTQMIEGRLSQLQDDARWDLDAEAFSLFANNLFFGRGAGATLSDGHRVHNFILGSACQAGIWGLILSTVFYVGIIVKVFWSKRILATEHGSFWIASIVVLPLLRAMTSGNSGTLSIIEWFCLSFFCAVILVKKEEIKYGILNSENIPFKASGFEVQNGFVQNNL